MRSEFPDLSLLAGVVAPEVLNAMRTAATKLESARIPYALAGALAVGAHGYPRTSKDVDFVVGDEAFTLHGGGMVTINPEVPVRVGNVPIDPISVGPDEPHLREALKRAPVSEGIPVLPVEALVYMKLRSPRRKDGADVVELVKAGIDIAKIESYLVRYAPDLSGRFKSLVTEAQAE